MKSFKCINKEGCRISDLNLQLKEGQIFERDEMVVQNSRGIKAALRSNWIVELHEKEKNAVA